MTGQAEYALLGGLMIANERFHEVAPMLATDHFTTPQTRRIFDAIRERVLAGEPADPVTLAELAPDDATFLIDLASNTPSAANVPTYARMVREDWRRREAVVIAAKLMAETRERNDGAIDAAITSLLALNAAVTECDHSLSQAMQAAWAQVADAHERGGVLPGIPTGITKLDEILGGWHDGDLVIIGARPAMGKTALMVNMAEAAAKAGKFVGIVSAEQPAIQIALRTLSLGSQVGAANLRRGRIEETEWGRLTEAIRRAREWRMRLYDRSAITLDELAGVARKWKHSHGLQCLFVDYAQRISVPGADRVTEVAAVARGLKDIARNLSIPVIALAQVIKGVDSRDDKRPNQGDLANSDELTREADEIIMLYREEAYYHEKNERDQPVRCGVAELLIEKNRHGPTGYAECAFLAETMRFADLER